MCLCEFEERRFWECVGWTFCIERRVCYFLRVGTALVSIAVVIARTVSADIAECFD